MAWLHLAQLQCVRGGRWPDPAQTYVGVRVGTERQDWGPFTMNNGHVVDLTNFATPSEFAERIEVTIREQAEDDSDIDIGTRYIQEGDKDAGLREVTFRQQSLPITPRGQYVLTYWVASAVGTESPIVPPKS